MPRSIPKPSTLWVPGRPHQLSGGGSGGLPVQPRAGSITADSVSLSLVPSIAWPGNKAMSVCALNGKLDRAELTYILPLLADYLKVR